MCQAQGDTGRGVRWHGMFEMMSLEVVVGEASRGHKNGTNREGGCK